MATKKAQPASTNSSPAVVKNVRDPLSRYPSWYRELVAGEEMTEKQRAEDFLRASIWREKFTEQERSSVDQRLEAIQGAWQDLLVVLETINAKLSARPTSAPPPVDMGGGRNGVPRLEDLANVASNYAPPPPPAPRTDPGVVLDRAPAPRKTASAPNEKDVESWLVGVRQAFGAAAPAPVINAALGQYLDHCTSIGEATSRPVEWICDRVEKLMGTEDPSLRGDYASYDDDPPPPPPPGGMGDEAPTGDVV